MHPKRLLGLAVVIAAGAILVTSAGAGSSALPKFDLSTHSGATKYLKSLGIDPKGVVIQRGLRNYAGPSCPGRLWHCTKARHVFQIAAAGGTNKFQCSDVSGTATSPPVTTNSAPNFYCAITQVSTSGNNAATCIEDENANPAVETCLITQTSVSGNNTANVVQKITQSTDSSQSATQDSEVDQTNTTGDNTAQVTQAITQDTKGAGDQTQTSDQTSCVKQHGPANPQGACFDAFPVSGASGNDSSNVDQRVNQHAFAGDAAVNQTQDNSTTGHASQDTTGSASAHNGQHEVQQAEGKNAFVDQSGPLVCCTRQGTSPSADFQVGQDSSQHTNSNEFFQDETIIGTGISTGQVHIDENANENGAHQHNSCDSSDCAIGIICASSSGDGGFAPTSSTGLCQPCTPFGEDESLPICGGDGGFETFSSNRSAVRPSAVSLLRRYAFPG